MPSHVPHWAPQQAEAHLADLPLFAVGSVPTLRQRAHGPVRPSGRSTKTPGPPVNGPCGWTGQMLAWADPSAHP